VQRFHLLLLAVVALLAGLYVSSQMMTNTPPVPHIPTDLDLVGSAQPGFSLLSNSGASVSNEAFAGDIVLINFWATWCVPCREEIPMLMDLHTEYSPQGFQVIGIALDDVLAVNQFVEEFSIGYPILVGEADVMATIANYGNLKGVLPYSVLVDQQGIIRWQYAGEVDRLKISSLIKDLL
jgi:thiol-disulfide isomerase/thioredoxin